MAADVLQGLMIFLDRHAQRLGDLVILGSAAFGVLHLGDRARHLTRFAVHRARRPIAFAYFIQHGAADTDTRVGLETRALCGVVMTHGLDQADHARLDQVSRLNARRQTAAQVIRNALHQRRIAGDQGVEIALLRLGVLRQGVHAIASACPAWISRSKKNCTWPDAASCIGHLSAASASFLNAAAALLAG